MKKFIITLIIFLFMQIQGYTVEEIVLEKEPLNLDYFSDVYYGKVENKESVSPILKLFSQKGYEFENSKLNAIKLTFLYDGQFQYVNKAHSSPYFKHDFGTVEPMISFFFNDRKTEFTFDYNLMRDLDNYSNSFTEKISRVFVSHKLNNNQTIYIGQSDRLPSTYDGSRGTMGQEMVLKSQLGRTFGEARSVGLRNKGKYKYVDYDIGLYDSTRYMKDFGNGVDFTGHVTIKPFAHYEDERKNFRVGGGYNIGKYNISYNVYSILAGYDHKKFHIHAEYAKADGYNGIKESRNNADGFYTLLTYDLTDKLSLLARYDYFTADRTSTHEYCNEYSAGFTYKLFKNMKFMLNLVNRNYSNKPDSNMILFATRFII